VLDLSERSGGLTPFLLYPAPGLLERRARHRTSHAALVAEIRGLLAGTQAGPQCEASPPSRPRPLLEPLSDSEVRVLRYLPTNLTTPEIARELSVSANTVKTHIRHLYAKLATITPLLTRETSRRPPDQTLRAAPYRYAFNPQQRRSHAPDPVTAGTLAWLERASLPVSQLIDLQVIRTALDGLCTRLDGSLAAANTISRKRAAFHGALCYAVELGPLPANPLGLVRWNAPRAAIGPVM
jgi:DNA-binding CsgD family transcriptional regulator